MLFFTSKLYCMSSAYCPLQHVQIWIQDFEIVKFKIENSIWHDNFHTCCWGLYTGVLQFS
jgi:hypothetical protein